MAETEPTQSTTITEADWAAVDALLEQENTAEKPDTSPKKAPAVEADSTDADSATETVSAVSEDGAQPDEESVAEEGDANAKNAVPVRERIEFRKEKRAWREKVDAEVKRLNEHYAAKEAELAAFVAAKKAADVGDFDGYAKALGFDDWNAANRRYAEEASSPGYKRLRELEERDRRREAELSKAEQERRAQAEQAQRQQAYQSLVTNTTKALETTGGLHAEFAKDPGFISMVLDEKRKAFNEGDEDISDADAADRALELIAEQHAKLLERFTKYADKHKAAARFKKGSRPTEKAETRDRERMPEKGRKNHVSHSRATEAGASGRAKTDAELLKEFGFG